MASSVDMSRRNKKPRLLTEPERDRLDEFIDSIHYSPRYSDSEYEYRHVQLPKNMLKAIPKDYFDASRGTLMLLWEDEWRGLGITQVRPTRLQAQHLAQPLSSPRLTPTVEPRRPINYQPPVAGN
ncbi:MAG: Cyclin-dependent kinases regulatory subunit (Cell division control protein cks1) [Thelocarpon impressellum]|nr:MAG: Cyclin-dependent kinases regulatory subunit (Cell division control protein cks1) [Thelocarpon impressellum]